MKKSNIDVKKLCVRTDTLLKEILTILVQTAAQIVIVINRENQLLGTITDGDIRRGLLKGLTLESRATEFMNSKPRTALSSISSRKIKKIFYSEPIRQLPLLDHQQRVVDIAFLKHFLKETKKDTPVVIMAGGFGKRLLPLTKNTPKPMLQVGDKPLLKTIIENLKEQGFCNIILSLNYLGDEIEHCFGNGQDFGVNIEYLYETKPLGTAGALSQLKARADSSFLVMNGDILTNFNFSDLLHYHAEERGIATICVREYDIQIPFGVAELDGQYLRRMVEKPTHSFLVNAGIYLLDRAVLNYIPEEQFYDMTELMRDLLDNRKCVACFHLREYWIDIGRLEQLEQAKREYKHHFGA